MTSTGPLRVAFGLVYFHFGFLKLFPDLSGAELLAGQVITRLGLTLDANLAVRGLGGFECLIGVLFLFGLWRRFTLALFFVHMAGTFMPLFLLPGLVFKFAPFAPTLDGQYVLKNIVFVAAGWVLLREARGSAPRIAASEST
ncbi:MAG: DoxX family membrane protein [Planctomycetes bacterium]|nr:DoxX family membrane protein [Planctomycetota bacterium]